MPRYDYVLFDADNTLFDFDRAEAEALRTTLAEYGLPVTPETEEVYLAVNRALWAQFDRGEVVYEARNVLRRFCWDGTVVVVKKYKVPILFNRFIYGTFRKSKARRSFEYAHVLEEKGFRTPSAVAYIEERRCGLFAESYLVTLNEEYPQMMRRFLSDESLTDEGKMVLRAFAAYTVRLHEAGVLHEDYSPGNIAFEIAGDKVSFSLFDINRMHFGRLSRKRCLHNLCRITPSIVVLSYLAGEYARLRGWNVEESVAEALRAQTRFFNWATYRYVRRRSRKP